MNHFSSKFGRPLREFIAGLLKKLVYFLGGLTLFSFDVSLVSSPILWNIVS